VSDFAEAIRQQRSVREMDLQQFAAFLGFDPGAVGLWERGHAFPAREGTIRRISERLNTSPADLGLVVRPRRRSPRELLQRAVRGAVRAQEELNLWLLAGVPCTSGKLPYATKMSADAALVEINSKELAYMRRLDHSYKCLDCRWWHLTSRVRLQTAASEGAA